ncbi:aldehyde dehydrogenase family protein [Aquabacter spiritensis]|uniref:Acyl-CoA reductase-like NAD-dependent aldehyde dehydrogenase n=1 Tax=Aquabacter spiritensis TaxID=933073 RepID=A0A4R3M2W9_9HYPH|nr:aldehyde dehydrogenase family protein [Aquabacter spiritensis]TCT07500.1 acyl-CoA reductase-like NAD-dependent aldehyde dehydrogenase [Aquabacter spiritensis]
MSNANSALDAASRAIGTSPMTGRMLLGGDLVESLGGGWMDCVNPANEDYIGRVPRGTAADVERAVAAAETAQADWAALSVAQRSDYLMRLGDAIMKRAEDILQVEVSDTGNPITAMRNDIASGVDRLRYFAGLGYELQGKSIPATPDNLHFTVREPYGVVGRILAFNHPINFAIVGMASPLMAGNAVILKPSEQSPLSASLLAEIARDILPPGVLNILSGDAEVGNALVRHPRVKRLSFVGSARTGMAIQRSAAEVAVKHVSLELGGKNPFIVFPDVDVDKVATAAVAGMNFTWQGQSCASTSRLFVHDDIYDAVLDRVTQKVAAIRVGDPFDPATQMGAINSAHQLRKVEHYVAAGREDGGRLVAGGKRPPGDAFRTGYWIEPTVFADVAPDARIAREEIFGPVLSVLRWSDVDAVVKQANAVEYGLTAAVWTRDISVALRTAQKIQAGYIWINGINAHVRAVPYGGYKNSGVGRERGIEEMFSYTEEKSIHIML